LNIALLIAQAGGAGAAAAATAAAPPPAAPPCRQLCSGGCGDVLQLAQLVLAGGHSERCCRVTTAVRRSRLQLLLWCCGVLLLWVLVL
jgi:hypothetical protein